MRITASSWCVLSINKPHEALTTTFANCASGRERNNSYESSWMPSVEYTRCIVCAHMRRTTRVSQLSITGYPSSWRRNICWNLPSRKVHYSSVRLLKTLAWKAKRQRNTAPPWTEESRRDPGISENVMRRGCMYWVLAIWCSEHQGNMASITLNSGSSWSTWHSASACSYLSGGLYLRWCDRDADKEQTQHAIRWFQNGGRQKLYFLWVEHWKVSMTGFDTELLEWHTGDDKIHKSRHLLLRIFKITV